MRKLIALTLMAFFAANLTFAQKFGYVNTQEILNSMEEYTAAQAEIDQQSQAWQKELAEMHENIKNMYDAFEEEAVLLPEDVKKKRMEAIFQEERKAKEYKKEKFGYDGALYQLQDEKIKPIQDKVFDAVQQVAQEKRLNFIFDLAGNTGIIYSDETFNRTADVKKLLNLQ